MGVGRGDGEVVGEAPQDAPCAGERAQWSHLLSLSLFAVPTPEEMSNLTPESSPE